MKTILIATPLYPPDIGGPATYSKLLEEELPKKGIKAVVVSFGLVRHLTKGFSHLVYFLKLLKHSKRADFIYAQDPVSVGLPAVFVSKIRHKKLLLKIVGDYAWEQGVQRFGVADSLDDFVLSSSKYGFFVWLLKLVQKFVARHASIVIVPSGYLKKIVTSWGINAEKIIVVYNAYDLPTDFRLTKNEARRHLKLNGKVIVSIGRLVPWKGFEALITSFKDVKKHFPDSKLYIIGSGPDENKLKEIISNFNLESVVILTGSLNKDELMLYLKSADVFVLNTKYEGFSHQLLEALALGVPIITTPVGGNLELIKDKENGLLVSYDDIDELSRASLLLLEDGSLANRLVESGVKTANKFNKDQMLENLLRVFS